MLEDRAQDLHTHRARQRRHAHERRACLFGFDGQVDVAEDLASYPV